MVRRSDPKKTLCKHPRSTITGLIATVTALILATTASAQPLPRFLCSVSAVTGFNWADGRWTLVSYRPLDYIMAKMEDASSECEAMLFGAGIGEGDTDRWGNRYGCWTSTQVGETPTPFLEGHLCLESYSDSGIVTSVRCDFDQKRITPFWSMRGTELHDFEFTQWKTGIVRSENGQTADSLYIEVGLCTPL